jgi:MFS family permease
MSNNKPLVYRNYLVAILLLIQSWNYVDRHALSLVLQEIKVDLSLSDTQLGLLTGIAFALFYSVMGIPIARWADRGNRVTIITITTALWSVAVVLCGVAGSFLQFLLIRCAVAVGEAGCIPPAYSLIADYFTRAERPRAVGVYMLGGGLSFVVGYFMAGWLNEVYGWRVTFMMLGLPGAALAAVTWFTLKEPRLERASLESTTPLIGASVSSPKLAAFSSGQSGLKDVFVTLWAIATYRQLLLCLSLTFFFNYGILQWEPTFFIRSYGLQTGELGTWFAVIYGLGGLLGTYLGGELASRFAANNERLQLKTMAMAYCSFAVIMACAFLSTNRYLAFGLLGVGSVGVCTGNGPFFATIQTIVPDSMRAVSIALIYLFANLIGMGLGPLVAGALSDALRPLLGEESLRYALLVLSPGYILAGCHLWWASKTVTRDIEAAEVDRLRDVRVDTAMVNTPAEVSIGL